MEKIREHTDVIRYLSQNVETYGADAWSKRQLIAMLSEISQHADDILRYTGITDLESHFEDVWGILIDNRSGVSGNGFDEGYRPYTEEG